MQIVCLMSTARRNDHCWPQAAASCGKWSTASFALDGHLFSLDMAIYEIVEIAASPPPQGASVTPGTYGRQGYSGAPVPVPDVMSPDGRWLARLTAIS